MIATYLLMLENEYDTDKLTKILSYIEKDLADFNTQINTLKTLHAVTKNRIKMSLNKP